jgi:outer membrane protein assembly factor BamA
MSEPPSTSPPGGTPSPPPVHHRGRRVGFFLLLAVLLLPVLILIAGWASLRSGAVRRAVLARVATAVEQGFGVDLIVEDFSLIGWTGVELRGVRLGKPGAAPLVRSERVRARVNLFSLRRETAVVRSLEVFSPVIDLSAPFPEIPESEGPPGVEIRKIALHGGRVIGAPLEPPATEWITRWRIDGIEAAGTFDNGPWDLTVKEAMAHVERPGFPPLPVRLSGRFLQATAGGILRITGVRADSDGLHLEGSSQIGEGGPIEVIASARVEPRLLVAGLPPGGLIEARGNFAPPAEGTLALSARDVPAEALRAYLEPQLFADLALAGTTADLRTDLTFGPEALERIEGGAEVNWRRGKRWLARVEGRVTPATERGAGPIRLTVQGDLLPDRPGTRHVEGIVTASGWAALADGTAEDLRAEIQSADVAASLFEIRALWPRLVPALPPDLPVRGALAADLRLNGPLADPRAKLQARWTPEAGAHVTLRAEGRPSTWTGRAEAEAERVPMGMIAKDGTGLLSGRLVLDGSPRAYEATLTADATAFAYPPSVRSVETLHAEVAGTLEPSAGAFTGTLTLDAAGLFASPNASDTLRLDRVQVAADGAFRMEPLSWTGDVKVDGSNLEMPGTLQADTIHLEAEDVTAGETVIAGRLRLDTPLLSFPGVGPGAGTSVQALHLEAEGDRREARILALSGELPEGRSFEATGRALLEPLLEEADLELRLVRPVDAVRSADLSASLRSGVVGLSVPRLDTEAGAATLRATVPLGALRQIPQLAASLDSLPFELTPGPIALTLEAPELDSERLLAALGMEQRPEKVRGALWTELTFEPAAPLAGHGEIRLGQLRVESPDGRVAAEGPVTASLADGALEIRPVRLLVDGAGVEGAGVDLRGRADLNRSWNPFEDAPETAIRNLAFDAGGTLEAALLNPFLEGGVASGALTFSASAKGPPDGLQGEVRASGPEASFFWASPYATRVQRPEITVSVGEGGWKIENGKLLLNGGPVEITGSGGLTGAAGEPVAVAASFSNVRYRLDYGLTTQLSGRLTLRMPAEGRSLLAGRVTIERAVLNRDVDLDRELLATFLQPDDTPGTEDSLLSEIDLDLRVATANGLRIRNNVADLRAEWSPLSVTGTLETPVIQGRVDVEPGGLLFAYGQTVRIDRGSLLFTGDPLLDPRIDLSTTSSLQDPTIAQLRGGDSPLALLESDEQPDNPFAPRTPGLEETVTAGLTGYYGARVASALGEAVGLQRISVQPVLVFGETDPSARLTVGGDVSRNASFALSVDLRNAQDRTYLVDLHGFRELPGLTLQGFTNDAGEEGANLQQVLELGGSRRRDERPRLRRLRLDFPEGGALRKRLLRRSIGLERRQPVSENAAFDVETELADNLRRRGWPDPRIEVEVVPAGKRRVDVNVRVAPGPHVEVLFEGDRPPRGTRAAIAALYRTDFYEPVAIEEMKEETVRALRRQGHLEPRVEIAVERSEEGPAKDPDSERRVTVRSEAGPRSRLGTLDLQGIDPVSGQLAAQRFPGPLARAELAVAAPGADRRLLDVLRALGYPAAAIAGRELLEDGDRLAVHVEAGERQVLRRIEIAGIEGPERDRLSALLPVQAGEPARLDRISEGALRIERSLEEDGFPDATVRPVTKPVDGTNGLDLRYEVAPGPAVRLTEVGFSGERWSRAAQLERVAGLETGMPYVNAAVEEARARLFDTGVFSRVTAEVERGEGEGEGEAARVEFSLTERPRFRIGYGARWESGSDKVSAVMDFVDTNFLGRALTLGLRGLYEPDDQSGRLYLRTGGLFGTGISLETYAQTRRFFEDGLIEDSREGALQLARPFGEDFTGRVYVRYRTTHLYEEEPDPFLPPFDIQIDRPYLGVQALWDSRNDRIDPVTGLFASLDLSGSGTWIGSDFDYRRAYGQVNLYRGFSLLGRRLVWAQSVRGGWAGAGSGQELLREERFFAGGDFSVRGYETESLGPQEVLGALVRPLGGEALFILNQELRIPLPFDLTGLLFFDAGQVWETAGDVDTDLAKALGFGLRARTPVGLLRIDVGFPLDRRAGEESYQLYFGFGNAF